MQATQYDSFQKKLIVFSKITDLSGFKRITISMYFYDKKAAPHYIFEVDTELNGKNNPIRIVKKNHHH